MFSDTVHTKDKFGNDVFFSCAINNPKDIVIKTEDYFAVPFGPRCTSALACKYADIRKFSLPFDWTHPLFPNKIQNVLENNFEDFIPDVHNGVFTNKYDFDLTHFNPNIDEGLQEYIRRIQRFIYIMNQPQKLYFIFMNEDYLSFEKYRQDELIDKIFNDMLELEKFIKEKYTGIDYNILYFDFKQHNIPEDSNIINFVCHSTRLYESENDSPFEFFRAYCGSILSKLFHTEMKLGYSEKTFHN
jgi:hypothetical protein